MDNLPNELYEKILDFVTLDSKKSLRLLSHRWRKVIDEKLHFNLELDDGNWKFVKNFYGDIHKLSVHNLTLPALRKNSRLNMVVFKSSNLNLNRRMLLNNKMIQVHFQSKSIPNLIHDGRLCLPKLVLLRIDIENLEDLQKALGLTKMELPSLSKVELMASKIIVATGVESYLGFYKFLANIQSQRLRSATVGHFQRSLPVGGGGEVIRLTECEIEEAREIIEKFRDIKLTDLSLIFSDLENFEGLSTQIFSIGISLLASQVMLTTLELHLMNHQVTRVDDPINQVIFCNYGTLKKIRLYSETSLHVLYNFFCPVIQHCTLLLELELTHYMFHLDKLKFPSQLEKLSLSGWASLQTDFEVLGWIAKNLRSLTHLNVQLNWSQYTVTTSPSQLLTLATVAGMPNLKRLTFINPIPMFKAFFQRREKVTLKEFEAMCPPFSYCSRCAEIFEVIFERRCCIDVS